MSCNNYLLLLSKIALRILKNIGDQVQCNNIIHLEQFLLQESRFLLPLQLSEKQTHC